MEILLFQEKGFRIGNQPSIYNKRDGLLINKANWKKLLIRMNQCNS